MAKWLTDSSVKRAGEGTHFDSSRCGLFLWVRGSSRRWYQSITIKGKRNKIAIGNPLMVSAEEARQKAFDNLTIARGGGDPRKGAIKALDFGTVYQPGPVPTFWQMAIKVIKLKSSEWKDAERMGKIWWSDLERFCLPVIGEKRLNEITRQDVKAILEPRWIEINPTMKKLRHKISEVFAVAMAEGLITDNPASDEILKILPKVNGGKTHHPFLSPKQVKEAVKTIRNSESYIGSRLCLELLILTGVRSKEAREIEWQDLDMETGIWTVPAGKMKMKQEHRIPLSKEVLTVLQKARKIGFKARNAGLVFPAQNGKVMDGGLLSRLIKREGIQGTDVHGFRSSFVTWANENNFNADAIESCLAHTTQGVRGAYMRGEFFEQRRVVMEAWGRYLT